MKNRSHKRWKQALAILLAASLVPAFTACGDKKNEEQSSSAKEPAPVKTEAEWQREDDLSVYFDGDLYTTSHDVLTYLMIGTDDSGNVEAAGTADYHGRMADFLLLVVLDKTAGKYGYLQINRDTMAEIERPGSDGIDYSAAEEQICTAHWYGTDEASSCENTVLAVSTLLGELDIDGYYALHMSDVGKLNASVGGVEVTIDEDLTEIDPALTEGKTLVLDDVQAQLFVRARMNVGDGENTSRMKRQRVYLTAYLDQAMEKLRENPNFINEMYQTFRDIAVTDITGGDISVITEQIRKGQSQGILQIDGKVKLGQALDDGLDHAEFYADQDSIIEQLKTLYSFELVPDDEDE